MPSPPDDLHRYHRQMLLPGIGEGGQRRLRAARALIVGCGALGTVVADSLARAGIGALTIVDRDVVELTNLQRQVLFDEADVAAGTPKALAAQAKLARVNGQVEVAAHVDDFSHRNAERYAEGADVILDGLDNFETRYLLNDLAVKHGLPYLYGGAVGTSGAALAILPHAEHRAGPATSAVTWTDAEATPCLRCIFPEAPPPGTTPTCDTAGVLGPLVAIVAAHQSAQAIKLLTGNTGVVDRRLLSLDLWTNEERRFDVAAARPDDAPECACCAGGRFEHLAGAHASASTTLCGRNAVQVVPADRAAPVAVDLAETGRRLAAHGTFVVNAHLLRGTLTDERGPDDDPIELTLFANGRAIVKGTSEPEAARAIYAKYVGG